MPANIASPRLRNLDDIGVAPLFRPLEVSNGEISKGPAARDGLLWRSPRWAAGIFPIMSASTSAASSSKMARPAKSPPLSKLPVADRSSPPLKLPFRERPLEEGGPGGIVTPPSSDDGRGSPGLPERAFSKRCSIIFMSSWAR